MNNKYTIIAVGVDREKIVLRFTSKFKISADPSYKSLTARIISKMKKRVEFAEKKELQPFLVKLWCNDELFPQEWIYLPHNHYDKRWEAVHKIGTKSVEEPTEIPFMAYENLVVGETRFVTLGEYFDKRETENE